MKKLLTILLCLPLLIMAQAPQGFTYQGVATDNNGFELQNQTISIQASILSSSATGTTVWQETHTTTTDTFGLFNVVIGEGTSTNSGSSATFQEIDWGAASHFMKVEIDVSGGSNYIHVGTSQMMSVPYALYAENVHNLNMDSILGAVYDSINASFASGAMSVSTFGDTLTLNGQSIIVPGISSQNYTPTFGTVTDIDGNTYQTIIINGKEWMMEDLLVSKYSNGTAIPQYTSSSNGNSSYNPNCLNPRYVYISNSGGSYIPRAYYNAYAIQTGNVCPTNWHVATEQDYRDVIQLYSSTDTTPSYYGVGNGYHFEWPNGGPALKSTASTGEWSVTYAPTGILGQATNESHLSLENTDNPGCTYINQFNYSSASSYSYFYTSTPAPVNGGNYILKVDDDDDWVTFQDQSPYGLYRVRCVKD